MEQRILGRTGHRSTLITLGGAALRPTAPQAVEAYIRFALDRGVNHVDIAPTYGSGQAEVLLGRWVSEYRDDLFLACKTQQRTRQAAEAELRRSLQRLQTDYVDLYQLHGLDDPEELRTALGEDGALAAIRAAKAEGLVRYIGITSHNPQTILLALESFDFDTVLLPVNYVLRAHPEPRNDYAPVLAVAKARNVGVIAMKSVAKGPWPPDVKTHDTWYQPFDDRRDIDAALWFTLSQDVTTAASASDIGIAKKMIDAAERFSPLPGPAQRTLLKHAASYRPLFPRITA
jgi:aryl-alcohol dehydrogenase-like predicted oxidoreductase